MNVVKSGSEYIIYGDSLSTFDGLPAASYTVEFHKMKGFYLQSFPNIEINEKVYGVHYSKVEKVFSSFEKFTRNLGVILSGDKGIGKSLFAKMVSSEAVKRGLPLIIINKYIPGIAEFISSIDQQVVVLFDEFDKTFKSSSDFSPQDEMLTLFDGVFSGKKLFIITCNKLHNLNDYLVNRPGRFHYHFRFNYPTSAEIEEYMKDKISEEFWGEIEKVVLFSKRTLINYDCLRAISFEINSGIPFAEAIKDLNIVNTDPKVFDVVIKFANGKRVSERISENDLFDVTKADIRIEATDWQKNYFYAIIDKSKISFNDAGELSVAGEYITIDWSDDGYVDDKDKIKTLSDDPERRVVSIEFSIRGQNAPIHYTV